jgi:hypothetical protein
MDKVTVAGDRLTALTNAPAAMACGGVLLEPFNATD